MTAGVTEGLDLLLTALLEPGDEVLLPSPGYPLYTAIAARLQAVAKPYFLDEAAGWAIDVAQLEAQVGPRTKALVLCNPHNPTGAVASRDALLAVLDVARRHRLVVLADEIYDRLVLEGTHVPTATLADDVPLVTLNGLSKAYLAPGWRVGWLAFHTPSLLGEVKAAVQRLADARLCGPGPFQYAVKPALEGPQQHLEAVRAKLVARRDVTVARLNALPGVSVVPPRGAFYALPSLTRDWPGGDEAFVLELLRETGVLFVHGDGFGQRLGSRHFRVVFLPPEPVLHRAFDLLADFLARR
jgi:alanine-synthesizing transaminase